MSEKKTVLEDLEKHVLTRTGRRIRNLAIDFLPEGIILRGQAVSYHVKQLAQHGIQEILPEVRLQNALTVL